MKARKIGVIRSLVVQPAFSQINVSDNPPDQKEAVYNQRLMGILRLHGLHFMFLINILTAVCFTSSIISEVNEIQLFLCDIQMPEIQIQNK